MTSVGGFRKHQPANQPANRQSQPVGQTIGSQAGSSTSQPIYSNFGLGAETAVSSKHLQFGGVPQLLTNSALSTIAWAVFVAIVIA
uniref:Uncharacterized protein n=1 Tax=Glossina palpalis gambiensis TaxID=67801 RepID=A0A1B0BFP2_9MUSC